MRYGSLAFLSVVACACACQAAPDYTEARAALAKYHADQAAIDPQGKDADAQRGKAAESLQRARGLYEQANAPASADIQVLREYAALLMAAGDDDLAAKTWQRLVRLSPADTEAWKQLGRSLSSLGHLRTNEALAALRRALELSPDADTHFLMGCVYRQEGLSELAGEAFAKALERDPQHWGARLAAATMEIQEGRLRAGDAGLEALGNPPPEYAAEFGQQIRESVERLLNSRRVLPDTPEDDMAYAKVMLRAGRAQDALEAADRCVRLAPADVAAWNFIGDVAALLGQRDRARQAYGRSLELQADQPRTTERLRALDTPPGQ